MTPCQYKNVLYLEETRAKKKQKKTKQNKYEIRWKETQASLKGQHNNVDQIVNKETCVSVGNKRKVRDTMRETKVSRKRRRAVRISQLRRRTPSGYSLYPCLFCDNHRHRLHLYRHHHHFSTHQTWLLRQTGPLRCEGTGPHTRNDRRCGHVGIPRKDGTKLLAKCCSM